MVEPEMPERDGGTGTLSDNVQVADLSHDRISEPTVDNLLDTF